MSDIPPKASAVNEDPMPSEQSFPIETDQDQQDGVRVAEAVAATWAKTSLITVYSCMWLLYFVNGLNNNLTSNLSAYITSDFSDHSALTVIGVVTNIMTAAFILPVAKVLNMWDRTLGLCLMLLVTILGLIMMAACNGIATYCAAQVFYTVGFTSIIFCVDVLTSDTSSLRDRGLAFGFTSSPYIITAFAGSPLSEQFHASNWRWAYGCIVIILPVVALPLVVTWELAKRKAAKQNHLQYKQKETRSLMETGKFYFIEFDVIGILLLIAGFTLFLLSFVLAGSTAGQWRSAKILCMLIIGGMVIIIFGLYERFWSPKPFIPHHLLTSRTVIGACLLDFTYQVSYYCWNAYFTSYLQVVYNASITQAGYISAIFDLIDPLWLIGCGYLIRVTGQFKWQLMWAVPLYILTGGLMIYFRSPGHSIGYMCMCEIFLGISGGTMILIEQVAVLAASKHEDYAAMLALLSLFGNLGGSVGNSISGAIWTNTFPAKLRGLLPDADKDKWEDIYGSLDVQLSYPVGSEVRNAINSAYALSQRDMLIAGTAIMALSIGWVFMIRNIRVKDNDGVKKVLF
ncbi:major facilitator superfamily domain-containing protein [Aspergillus avenaceus]|uniref:Major facilitator superfamily domain-containing protein n=1 Tax=Aspergillus avenaceus TaxID=36643 RepID=A0A5N6U132_ASPAV|nr:major facilitator superfamily domain-containing protein [Aspergillus avenaceus]